MKTHHLIIISGIISTFLIVFVAGIDKRRDEMRNEIAALKLAQAEAPNAKELDKLLHALAKEKMSEAQNLIWRSSLEIRVMESGKNDPVRFFNANKYAKQAEEKNREALEILKHVSK